jgi:hypothetical protein
VIKFRPLPDDFKIPARAEFLVARHDGVVFAQSLPGDLAVEGIGVVGKSKRW